MLCVNNLCQKEKAEKIFIVMFKLLFIWYIVLLNKVFCILFNDIKIEKEQMYIADYCGI